MSEAIVHQEFDPQTGMLSFYTYEVLTNLLRELVEKYPKLAQPEYQSAGGIEAER